MRKLRKRGEASIDEDNKSGIAGAEKEANQVHAHTKDKQTPCAQCLTGCVDVEHPQPQPLGPRGGPSVALRQRSERLEPSAHGCCEPPLSAHFGNEETVLWAAHLSAICDTEKIKLWSHNLNCGENTNDLEWKESTCQTTLNILLR